MEEGNAGDDRSLLRRSRSADDLGGRSYPGSSRLAGQTETVEHAAVLMAGGAEPVSGDE
jgi:hypothetical protein